MRHKLLDKNEVDKTAWCVACNKEVKISLHKRNGRTSSWRCLERHRQLSARYLKPSNHKYRHAVKKLCESCGFIPSDMCQLDVDHIDGNHNNNDESNLQTLCANCHRLKTKLQKDGMYNR